MPVTVENQDTGEEHLEMGVQADNDRFWLYALAAMMCLLALALIYKKFLKNKCACYFVRMRITILPIFPSVFIG